jgi:hypothetical protein
MSDELDDYQEGAERAEAREDELERELAFADAEEWTTSPPSRMNRASTRRASPIAA